MRDITDITVKEFFNSKYYEELEASSVNLELNKSEAEIKQILIEAIGEEEVAALGSFSSYDFYDDLTSFIEAEVSIYTSELLDFFTDSDNEDLIAEIIEECPINNYSDITKVAAFAWHRKEEALFMEDLEELFSMLEAEEENFLDWCQVKQKQQQLEAKEEEQLINLGEAEAALKAAEAKLKELREEQLAEEEEALSYEELKEEAEALQIAEEAVAEAKEEVAGEEAALEDIREEAAAAEAEEEDFYYFHRKK